MKTISIKSYRTLLATRDDREHTHLALRHALRRALIVRSAGQGAWYCDGTIVGGPETFGLTRRCIGRALRAAERLSLGYERASAGC
jgi:hypothetical protein